MSRTRWRGHSFVRLCLWKPTIINIAPAPALKLTDRCYFIFFLLSYLNDSVKESAGEVMLSNKHIDIVKASIFNPNRVVLL